MRIKATGLCGESRGSVGGVHVLTCCLFFAHGGSDLHYYQHGRNGDFALAHPMSLGHESAGEVVAVGSSVERLHAHIALGSRVVIEPGLNCTDCAYCLDGRYNLCPSMRFASSAKTTPHLDGTLQQFFTWPARLCHV